MHALRHLSQRLSWIAFLAVFALVVVPTVSRLLAAAQGGSAWAEICTLQGAKPTQTSQPLKTAGLHGDHCALCGLSSTAFVPPPAAALMAARVVAQALPAMFWTAPRPLFAWAAARPRGPPAAA